MTNLKIGVATRHFGLPLRRALVEAGRIGSEGVQIDLRTELPLADCSQSALREIRKLLDDQRLKLASVAFPTRRGYGEEEQLERRLAATQQAMDIAGKLGARVVANHIGQLPASDGDESYDRLVESLTLLARHGDRVGARLALQPSGEQIDRIVELLAHLPEQTVGIDFAPAELVKRGQTPQDAIAQLGPHITHVAAADAVRESGSRATDVPLGRGMVDLPELIARLEQFEYQGWVTVQCEHSTAPAEELSNAVAYLGAILREG